MSHFHTKTALRGLQMAGGVVARVWGEPGIFGIPRSSDFTGIAAAFQH